MTIINLSPSVTEAIGRTLMHSIWIGFLLFSLLKLFLFRIPIRHAKLRYRLSGITLLLYTGVVTMLFFSLYDPSPETGTGSGFIADAGLRLARGGAIPSEMQGSPYHLWRIITILYFAGFVWMLLRVCFSLTHLQKIRKSGYPAGPEWSERLAELAISTGVRRKVRLLESHLVGSPGLFGWLRPAIIVPAGMLTQMPLPQIEAILIHELYHLKRLDDLINLFQIAAEGIFFYHPAVWMISRIMREEREHCCDDLVVRSGNPPLLYARALSMLSDHYFHRTELVTPAGGTDQPALLTRISRILNHQHMKTNIRERLFTLALFVTGIVVMVVLNGFSSGISIVKHRGMDPHVAPSAQNIMAEGHQGNPETSTLTILMDTVPVIPQQQGVSPDQAEEKAATGANVHRDLPQDADVDVEKDIHMDVDRDVDRDVDEATDFDLDVDIEVQEALEEVDWEALKAEMQEAAKEVSESIDWDAIKQEMAQAQQEAMEEIDWDAIHKEMEQAKLEALEEIDWDAIHKEMEQASKEISESVDWDAIKQEMQQASKEISESVDWDAIKQEMQQAQQDAMEEIDWDAMKREIQDSMEEINWEQLQLDINNSLKEIDIEGLKQEIQRALKEMDQK